MSSYKELSVWEKSMDLVVVIYKLTKSFPKEETYALCDQMRRAVVSIPSNIAEGQSRGSLNDFIRFLSIAQGSRAELETQIEICERIGYLENPETLVAKNLLIQIRKMIVSLQDNLRKKQQQQFQAEKK
ncbi:MAG: four helix bundle protein [Anaerolineaceae bacterium]|nr:four helix bundle protein [Anaerolineaceae bacterium]